MVGARKRKRIEDEEIGLVYRRRRRREKELEQKASGSRFPKLADGSTAKGFATLSHSNLKSWAHVSKAQGHNTRAIDTPNARNDAPAPIELLEDQTGPYVDRIKAVLVAHDVPVRIRKNGTIATEDVLGASPEYWNRDGDWKEKSVDKLVGDPVVQAALAYARKKHGKRLISCSLHLDEESPHIHVVAVPLVFREHAVRGPRPKDCELDAKGKRIDYRPKVEKWTLDVSRERGLSSQLERNHDEWAEACKHVGLARGERGSDLELEERRARRNEQSGRASMTAKLDREDRERKNREADEAVRDGNAKRDQLIAEGVEEFNKMVTAAAAAARNITERAELAAHEARQDIDRARKMLEDAELAKKSAEEILAEAEGRRRAQAEQEQHLFATLAQATTEKDAAAADRKKAAETKASLEARVISLAAQLGSISLVLAPDSETRPVLVNGEVMIEGNQKAEVIEQFKALPKTLRRALREQLKHRARLNDETARLQHDRNLLDSDRRKLESDSEAVGRIVALASEFEGAWRAIPETQRAPAVQLAIKKAQGLTSDDLPPGFPLPGRGGFGMG